MSRGRIIDVVLGCAYFALVAAFLFGAVLFYQKAFTPHTTVTLTTGTLGNAIQKGSDVKLRGVPVGTVTGISPTADGAELTLELKPSVADELSSSTTARLLPKTLFGERYVALQAPSGSTTAAATLAHGGQIRQDTTQSAVELQEVLDQMLPLLRSIQPEKLSATLGEMAAALRGQGSAIGGSMDAWQAYFKKLNPLVPQMADDFASLGRVATQYADAVPDLLDALDTMTTTSATLVAERDQLSSAFATVIDASNTSTGWVKSNDKTIRVLSASSRKALEAAAPYASEFPCLFRAMKSYIPAMDANLGKGTKEPGIHVVLNVVSSRGKYLAGQDSPRYNAQGGPRCPYVTGQTGTQSVGRAGVTTSSADTDGTAGTTDDIPTIAAPTVSRLAVADTDLGEVNSPAESELINELIAPTKGQAPSTYPTWSSLLLGPILRGTEVTVK
ncbi:MCE family protein [Nocardioides sp.]|uniref:MCE family protein n=1 Tax=Nocardioides sp. TaxID=35761 RepID=UPI002631A472|nr:MCE family protein [Nocardioides sp.]